MSGTYITNSGDTFDIIAKKVYGSEVYADTLMIANPDLITTFKFASGVTVKTPELSETVDGSLPPWKIEG